MTAQDDIDFLRSFQQLLDEGSFVSTYKFALLQALADLSVELDIETDRRLHVPIRAIARKFISYYWRQALPYQGGGVLQQNTGSQAEVIRLVQETRAQYRGSLAEALADSGNWPRLEGRVASVVRKMPLWKLQTVGSRVHEFLYRQEDFRDDRIVLLPGVADAFRNFHSLLTHLIRSGWITQIQRIGANQVILGSTEDLPNFLFGLERQSLTRFREVLSAYQQNKCFYCGNRIREGGELDHFVPWARYPLDVGQNFVLAHRGCNNAKRDFLPAIPHLKRWRDVNLTADGELVARLEDAGLPSDPDRTLVVARWAYDQGAANGAQLWIKGQEFSEADERWREVLPARLPEPSGLAP